MSTLIFTSRIGPTEGALLSSCRAGAGEAVFFTTANRELHGDTPIDTPSWLGHPFFPEHHPLAARFFHHLAETNEVERVLAVGLDASAYALQVLHQREVTPLLFRGDLDFSAMRASRTRQFSTVNQTADHLVLEDPWEMDKAVGHGSVLPHFRLPSFSLPGEHVLRRTGPPRVAILVPDIRRQDEYSAPLGQLVEAISGVGAEATVVDIRLLYGARDLAMRRGFTGTMRYRIGDYTHVVILGDSRHTWAVFNGLANDLDRVYVQDTFNSHYMYPDPAWPNAARGAALVDRVCRGLLSEVSPQPHEQRPSRPAAGWIARVDRIRHQAVPWCFEEDPRLEDGGFDVFLSVAPIENRTNGARPQRIRNMAEAFEVEAPVIRLSPHPHVLHRRRAWMSHLVQAGARPRFLYGENSTSPMATTEAIDVVAGTVRDLKASGCRVGWFVRDLHWLSPEAEHLNPSSPEGKALVARGLHEMRSMAQVADVFFAPCESAIQGFKDFLGEEVFRQSVEWKALPPAISTKNLCFTPGSDAGDQRVTLVYSGGVGGFYNLDPYIEAITGLQHDAKFDFIVRAEDVPRLTGLLAARGLHPGDGSVSVQVGNMADYAPSTVRAVGVVLLNGDYGRLSFPYKVMTALERRMPVLAYAGTDYGDFVTREGVGFTCEPAAGSIREAIQTALQAESATSAGVPDSTLERNTWEARAAAVREALRLTAAAAAGAGSPPSAREPTSSESGRCAR